MAADGREIKRAYRVYVIELDRAVMEIAKFRDANPGARTDRKCVYVGATSLPAEERFAQHQSGKRANRFVRKFGSALVLRLMRGRQGYKTWNEAIAAERRCAGKLRRRGYGVWSG